MTLDQIKKRYEGFQDLVKDLKWSDSCLFLCLCSIIEEANDAPVDIVWVLKTATYNGHMDKEFYIKDSIAILERHTGKKFTREVLDPEQFQELGTIPDNWFSIEVWERGTTKHFRRRFVDTLKNSQTVKYGKLSRYYVYKMS